MPVRRGREDRHDLSVAHGGVQGIPQLVVRELLAVQVARKEVLVRLDDRFHELLAVLADAVGLFLRKLGDGIFRALEELAVQEVDRRGELLVLPDGHVERHDPDAVRLAKLAEDLVEVGVLAVEPADEEDARRPPRLELVPRDLRAHLDPRGRVDEHDRGVRDPHPGALVGGEVRVAGRIDEVDLHALVREGGEGHVDGDVALLLLGIGVEDARRVVHLAQARGRADSVQERFDEARLAGAAVTDDDDVADLVRLDRRHS